MIGVIGGTKSLDQSDDTALCDIFMDITIMIIYTCFVKKNSMLCFRKRIVAEKGLPRLEQYMFEDHELLKRAATECMCNMVMNEEVLLCFIFLWMWL